MIYFTSDPHFFHENIIGYCDRPFKNIDEMHETIIKNFKIIKDEDVVFWLGDFGFYEFEKIKNIFKSIKGNHILIRGNHDKQGINTYYHIGFKAVLESAEINISKNKVTLEHYPRRTFIGFVELCFFYIKTCLKRYKSIKQVLPILRREWKKYKPISKNWHICGHVHNKWKIKEKNINVGVDSNNFKPVSISEIARIINLSKNHTTNEVLALISKK